MRMPHRPLQSTYEREEVQTLIVHNSPRIKLVEHGNARSDIWRHFRRVYLDDALQPYVRCNYCAGLIISRHGTSSLLRHNCQTLAQIKQEADQTAAAAGAAASGANEGSPAGLDVAELERRQQLQELAQYHSQAEQQLQGHQEAPLSLQLASAGLVRDMVTKYEEHSESDCSAPDVGYDATMEVTGEDERNVTFATSSTDVGYFNRYDAKPIVTSATGSVGCGPTTSTTGNGTSTSTLQLRVAAYQVSFAVEDLLPVETVERSGFRKLAQALIDVGADHGRVSLNDVLVPTASLVTYHLPSLCRRVRQRLIPTVLAHDLCLAMDSWSAEDAHRRHLTLTAHYVDDDFQLRSAVLGTRELFPVASAPLPVYHSNGDVTASTFTPVTEAAIEILALYTGNADEANRKLRSSVVVCEERLDRTACFSSHRCACSMLTAILDDVIGLEEDAPFSRSHQFDHQRVDGGDELGEYRRVANEALRTMAELRRRESEVRPERPLPSPLSSGWTRVYEALCSVLENLDDIQRLADHDREQGGGAGGLSTATLSRSVLTPLVQFLQLFRRCLDSLCSDTSYATINLCVLWKLKLERHCHASAEVEPGAQTVLNEVRATLLKRLRSDFVFERRHHVALLLDPNFKSLKMLSEEARADTLEHAAELMREVDIARERLAVKPEVKVKREHDEYEGQSSSSSSPPPNKRSRILMNFTEFLDAETEGGAFPRDRVEAELQRYVATAISYNEDVLHFWKTGGGEFPALQKVARRVLAVPACSAAARYPSETRRRQWADRRTRLDANVDELLLLHGTIGDRSAAE